MFTGGFNKVANTHMQSEHKHHESAGEKPHYGKAAARGAVGALGLTAAVPAILLAALATKSPKAAGKVFKEVSKDIKKHPGIAARSLGVIGALGAASNVTNTYMTNKKDSWV